VIAPSSVTKLKKVPPDRGAGCCPHSALEVDTQTTLLLGLLLLATFYVLVRLAKSSCDGAGGDLTLLLSRCPVPQKGAYSHLVGAGIVLALSSRQRARVGLCDRTGIGVVRTSPQSSPRRRRNSLPFSSLSQNSKSDTTSHGLRSGQELGGDRVEITRSPAPNRATQHRRSFDMANGRLPGYHCCVALLPAVRGDLVSDKVVRLATQFGR